MDNKYYVFVYGSLKNGFENSHYLKSAEFIGEAISLNPEFKMYSVHDGYPALTKGNEFVKGEIYSINDLILRNLDILEGYPNFYNRKYFKFVCNNKPIDALVYYFNDDKEHINWLNNYLKSESKRILRDSNTAEWLKRKG